MNNAVGQPVYDWDLLSGFCSKAERLVFNPMARGFRGDPDVSSLDQDALLQMVLETEPPSTESTTWHRGLSGLQGRVASLAQDNSWFDRGAAAGAFPSHEDASARGDPRYCPRGLLSYLAHEFLGHLYAEGKIICLAEDAGRFAVMPYGGLFMEYSGELEPPLEGDFWMPEECDAEDLRKSGAGCLWYAFSRDFVDLGLKANRPWRELAEQCPDWSKDSINTPFVREVVELVMDEGLSAKAASERVVGGRGHSSTGVHHKPGTVVGTKLENAVENLSRGARRILKDIK